VRICGGGSCRVLFSESPPLKRKNSGQPPDEQPGNGSLCGVPCVGGAGCVGLAGGGFAGLQSFAGSGKFEKLLRSEGEALRVLFGAGCVCCLRTQ
jgi:hypothetical protein